MRDTLIVTGWREWSDFETMHAWLTAYRRAGITRLVHGGARGADEMAGSIGYSLGFMVQAYPWDPTLDGDWSQDAGPRRNHRMVEAEHAHARCGAAFSVWKGGNAIITKGTGDCVSRMFARGLSVTLIAPGSRPNGRL